MLNLTVATLEFSGIVLCLLSGSTPVFGVLLLAYCLRLEEGLWRQFIDCLAQESPQAWTVDFGLRVKVVDLSGVGSHCVGPGIRF